MYKDNQKVFKYICIWRIRFKINLEISALTLLCTLRIIVNFFLLLNFIISNNIIM
jgi:alpha-N-acetylglucosamine transferase